MPTFALAALGFLKRIPWQAWALLGLAILVGTLYLRGNHWEGRAHRAEAQVATACAATREASANLKLDCARMPDQVKLLGRAVADLKAALAKQNAAVNALAAETVRQQQLAAQAIQQAAQRAKAPARVSADLSASARAPERLTKPCEPSPTLRGAWK